MFDRHTPTLVQLELFAYAVDSEDDTDMIGASPNAVVQP